MPARQQPVEQLLLQEQPATHGPIETPTKPVPCRLCCIRGFTCSWNRPQRLFSNILPPALCRPIPSLLRWL